MSPAQNTKETTSSKIPSEVITNQNNLQSTGTASSYFQSDTIDVIGFINHIFESAVNMNASDIHIEPKEETLDIRFRVDGEFTPFKTLSKEIKQQLVTRIKILAGLKIDENRLPQDGKAIFPMQEQNIDLRVSTLPVVYGEKVVIRILKKKSTRLTLPDIGVIGMSLERIEHALKDTYGIILSTGPTGSGKSTTLYSLLANFDPTETNISTLEDPVEYNMKDVNQSQINPDIGFDFSDGLRALLRQDPNIIMVGEIRDQKTAKLAIEAALTGHLVFSTLHTNDASTTIQRLVEMGVQPFLISSSLRIVIAQRLVRRVCPYCRIPFKLEGESKVQIEKQIGHLLDKSIDEITFFKANSCDKCNKGYKGRVGIFEVLTVSPTIQSLILSEKGVDSNVINAQALKEGMITLLQDALIKCAAGATTIDEAYRIIGS